MYMNKYTKMQRTHDNLNVSKKNSKLFLFQAKFRRKEKNSSSIIKSESIQRRIIE